MKANAPKRKVFQDATDLLTSTLDVPKSDAQMIPIDKIKPFRNHPFRLYEGERLMDMVESVKAHGVLMPMIVLETDDEYEMLAGHNRMNASKLAGLDTVPAIVKKDLSEEEAYVYVIETNVIQRSFAELLPSEKAAVLKDRYEKVICQGKRKDILEEISRLTGKSLTCGQNVHKSKSRDAIGEEYGMVGRNIGRYLRLNFLTDDLKALVDDGKLNLTSAIEFSYLEEEEQKLLQDFFHQYKSKVPLPVAKQIRKESGSLTTERLQELFAVDTAKKRSSEFRWFLQFKEKYLGTMTPEQMEKVLVAAVESYLGKEVADV